MRFLLRIVPLLCLGIVACRNSTVNCPVERTRFLMDTLVRISVYDRKTPKQKIEKAIHRALVAMEAMEVRASIHVDTSDVSRIVANAGRHRVRVAPSVYQLLQEAVAISGRTQGSFDVTVGLLKDCWGFDSDCPRAPERALLDSLLSYVDYRKIDFDEGTVRLRNFGMRIDLGGIAKGYIIDRAVEILEEEGMGSGIVDAGGDLRAFGAHPDGRAWKLGLQHPRRNRGELIGVLEVGETSVATSGDYERYFVQDGRRYHHILNPETGFPATGCVSVTIVAERALLADAYATAVFVMGPEKGMVLIERLPAIEGMIVYEDEGQLRRVVSQGLRQKIHFE